MNCLLQAALVILIFAARITTNIPAAETTSLLLFPPHHRPPLSHPSPVMDEDKENELYYMDEVIPEGSDDKDKDEDDVSLPDEDDYDEDASDEPIDVRKFLEAEAELSGEDESGDEAEDDEENDKYEEDDEAENADVGDEIEQREGIAKIFHRQQADEDKRQVLILQERMFEDGDLHMNGRQRKRVYRWRNVKPVWIGADYNSSDDEDGENDPDPEPQREIRGIKLHFKKDFPDLYPEFADQNGDSSATLTEKQAGDSQKREPLKLTPFNPIFGGPAGTMDSYLMKDKVRCEALSANVIAKINPAERAAAFLRKNKRKHKVRRTGQDTRQIRNRRI